MRLVKCIVRKIDHIVEDFIGDGFLDTVFDTARHV